MMDTRCAVCGREATRKCTDCGKVFCDLHHRLGSQETGRGFGGQIGYFCDECWEKQKSTRSSKMVSVMVLLLVGVAAALFLNFRGAGDGLSPWPMQIFIILGILVSGLVVFLIKRR